MKNCVVHYISGFLPITEVWLYNLIKSHRLFDPVVLNRKILNPGNFPLENVYSLEKLPINKLAYNFIYFKSMGYFPYFNKICQSTGCELIHAHFGYNAFKTIGLARKQNKALVCSFYGGDVYKYPMKTENKSKYQKLFRNFSMGIVLGPYMKQYLVEMGCPPEKLTIIHLGVDVGKIAFKTRYFPVNQPIRFLMASSFIEKKGIDIALKALKMVEKESNFVLEIIGDGPLKEDLLFLIKKLNLGEKVILHGYRPYSFFLNLAYTCDIFLQPSRTAFDNDKEGTPMAVIDAMATGLPVISTRHSDIPEIVDDGITGFLATENDAESLANAIRRTIYSGQEFHIISQNCRKKIEEGFDIRKQTDKLEQLYIQIK